MKKITEEYIQKIKDKNPNHEVKLRDNGSISLSLKCKDKSKTMQEFKDEVNINNIMSRYKKTGVVSHIMKDQPMFDDVSETMSYREALQLQITASENFIKLPAKVRARFRNDPAYLMDFLNNSNNYDEAVNLGLVDPKKPAPAQEPPKAPIEPVSQEPKANPS